MNLAKDSPRAAALRPYGLLALLYALSRIALLAMGMPFHLDLGWMFLSDPRWLREDFWSAVYYFHAFPPGMNILTGALLQLGDAALMPCARFVFWSFGLALTLCVYRLGLTLGRTPRGAMVLAFAFCVSPPALYFEHLYLYTLPTTAMLAVAAVLLVRATTTPSWARWFSFFSMCALIGWLRSTFHLYWFIVMGALALALCPRGRRLLPLTAALLPLSLLLALYIKNLMVFGVFGATSWGSANLTTVTTAQLPPQERRAWIEAGKISPYATTSVFAQPRTYFERYPELREEGPYPWPYSNVLTRPSLRQGNFNHGLFLTVNAQRRKDAAHYLRERPLDYLRTAATTGLPKVLGPSTAWHPRYGKPEEPHYGHRQVLGPYERAYNALLHTVPLPGPGVYVFIPLLLGWGFWRAYEIVRTRDQDARPVLALLLFAVLQIGFVLTISSLFTINECARYRFMVEPFLWLLTADALAAAWAVVRRRHGASRPDLRKVAAS